MIKEDTMKLLSSLCKHFRTKYEHGGFFEEKLGTSNARWYFQELRQLVRVLIRNF